MMYGCETWVGLLTKESRRRVLAFERKCYRKILKISWTEKISNEEVYERVGLMENLIQKVIQRKLGMFGHICRMREDRKIKALVFGIMEGKDKRGRQHREWTDDIGVEQICRNWVMRHRTEMNGDIVKRASDTYGH